MQAWFDLEAIGRSAARFDFAKLEDLNAHYIRQSSNEELLAALKAVLPELEGGPAFDASLGPQGWDRFAMLLPSMKERARTLKDFITQAQVLVAQRPLQPDDKAAKLLDAETRAVLGQLGARLKETTTWEVASLEADVRSFADQHGLKLGKIAQPIRAALTGTTVSPPVFDVMAALGRDEVLARLADIAAP
jgi:glutamyl-tRNA synthetase